MQDSASLLRNLDDLPKVERVSNYSNANKVKTFVFVKSSNYKAEDSWKELTLEIGRKEIVYVEINRWQPVNGGIISGSTGTIKSTLETLEECGITRPTVVGLKSAFLSTKQFKNGNFITFDEYVRREFTKVAPASYYEYDHHKMAFLRAINEIIKHEDVAEVVNLANSCKKDLIAEVCKRIGIINKITIDDSIEKLMDAFYDKYKMLKFVDKFDLERNREIVAEYISGELKKTRK